MTNLALGYLSAGWSVVPIEQGKKMPSVPWLPYQTTRPTEDTVRGWFRNRPDLGLGVVCGQVSGGLAVLDFDDATAYGRWAKAHPDLATKLPTATSGRGHHVFFTSPDLLPSSTFTLAGESEKAGDLLAEKRLVVLPPTRHSLGALRSWVTTPGDNIPNMTLEGLGVKTFRPSVGPSVLPSVLPPGFYGESPGQVPEGQRHTFLACMAGRLRNMGLGNDALVKALAVVNTDRCASPVPDTEVQDIATWAANRHVHSSKEWGREDEDTEVLPPDTESLGDDDDEGQERMFLPLPEYLRQTRASEVKWIVEGLLPEGYLVVLGGTSKAGKSCFLTSLALHVVDGRPFMGLPVNQGNVLWVALEESEGERRIALEAYDGEPEGMYTTHHALTIDKPECIEALRHWIRKTGAKLLVIDPLLAAHGEQSLTDGSAARRVLQPLKRLCREEGVTAILVHHLTKSNAIGMVRERLADSGQILAACSQDILLDATELEDGTRELVLHSRGRGEHANQNWVIRSDGIGQYRLLRHGPGVGKGAEATEQVILDALEALGTATAEALAQATSILLGTVRNRLTAMVKTKQVEVVGKEDKANLYQAA